MGNAPPLTPAFAKVPTAHTPVAPAGTGQVAGRHAGSSHAVPALDERPDRGARLPHVAHRPDPVGRGGGDPGEPGVAVLAGGGIATTDPGLAVPGPGSRPIL
jgi:hypothetical protein